MCKLTFAEFVDLAVKTANRNQQMYDQMHVWLHGYKVHLVVLLITVFTVKLRVLKKATRSPLFYMYYPVLGPIHT